MFECSVLFAIGKSSLVRTQLLKNSVLLKTRVNISKF